MTARFVLHFILLVITIALLPSIRTSLGDGVALFTIAVVIAGLVLSGRQLWMQP